MTTQWISSEGGPLVLCTKAAAVAWNGVDGDDYELACSVDGFLGAVSSHGHGYLVFADEPMATTFFHSGETLVVAQWVACESRDRARDLLCSLPETLDILADEVDFELTQSAALLFDSGAPGDSLEDVMTVPLSAGRYLITTENYVGPGFRFIIYRFRPYAAA